MLTSMHIACVHYIWNYLTRNKHFLITMYQGRIDFNTVTTIALIALQWCVSLIHEFKKHARMHARTQTIFFFVFVFLGTLSLLPPTVFFWWYSIKFTSGQLGSALYFSSKQKSSDLDFETGDTFTTTTIMVVREVVCPLSNRSWILEDTSWELCSAYVSVLLK